MWGIARSALKTSAFWLDSTTDQFALSHTNRNRLELYSTQSRFRLHQSRRSTYNPHKNYSPTARIASSL